MSFGIAAGTWLAAGAAVAGGAMAAGAAGDAADAQSASAAQSDATQRYQYDTTRADNAPFRETGLAANNRLAQLMGISSGASGGKTREQLRAELLSGFTTQTGGDASSNALIRRLMPMIPPGGNGGGGAVDEAGLNAAIEVQLAQQQADQNDPAFGSLMRKFGASDLADDAVYQSGLQFGLNEGTKGINRQAAAGGSMLSGATLKALTRFGNDYGSTKANESYNRFTADQNGQYNKLAGLSGAGQQATNQVSAAGQNMANNISASQQGVGNARGSAYLTQGNAWQNALNGGVSAWKQSQTPSASQDANFFDGTGAWRA